MDDFSREVEQRGFYRHGTADEKHGRVKRDENVVLEQVEKNAFSHFLFPHQKSILGGNLSK